MPIFYPSDHPSTIVRPEERHRSPSARKDELQGRARKSECPKRSVATQVFRISSRARFLWMYQANFPAPAGAFSCVKTRKGGRGRWGLAPTPWQTKGRARMPPINHPVTQPKNHICPLSGDALWGVCNTPLPIRMKTIDRRRRGVLHTPHKRARQGPNDPNKCPIDTTPYPHSSTCRGHLMGRMQYAPTLTAKKQEPEA